MRKYNLTLNAQRINFTDVLLDNCSSNLANSAVINWNEDNLRFTELWQ